VSSDIKYSWTLEEETPIDPRFWEACEPGTLSQLELDMYAQAEQAKVSQQAEWDAGRELSDRLLGIERVLLRPAPGGEAEKADALARLAQAEGPRPVLAVRRKHSGISCVARQLWNGDISAAQAVEDAEHFFDTNLPPEMTTLRGRR